MNKFKLIKEINDIVDFISFGEVILEGQTFNGHPNFFLKHSKV